MNYFLIGKTIRDLRIKLNMTQKELSEMICTQGQLSKIEKGEFVPSSTTLYELAQRLDVTTDYLFNVASNPRYDYIEETFEFMRRAARERNYEQLRDCLAKEQNNILFQNPFCKQFLLWHQGIVEYYVNHDMEKALDCLYQALVITKNSKVVKQRAVEILNSIAILYLEEKQYEIACQYFEQCLQALQNTTKLEDPKIRIRVSYNYSIALYKCGLYENSAKQAQHGILICRRMEILYLLGELYYQRGIALKKAKKEPRLAKTMLQKAKNVFTLQEKTTFSQAVDQKLQEWGIETKEGHHP